MAAEIEKLQAEADAKAARLEKAPPLPDPVDVSDLRRQIDELTHAIHGHVAEKNQRQMQIAERSHATATLGCVCMRTAVQFPPDLFIRPQGEKQPGMPRRPSWRGASEPSRLRDMAPTP